MSEGTKPRRNKPWEEIRSDFVHGEFRDGRHVYPTMEQLAVKYNVSLWVVQRLSKKDGAAGRGTWLEQRQQIEALARARQDTIQADRIGESRATFDNHTLLTAHAGMSKLSAALRAWEGVEIAAGADGRARPRLRAKAAAEIAALASALISFQRAGRLALGYATDNVAWRGEMNVSLSEAFQAWLAKVDVKKLSQAELDALETLTKSAGTALEDRTRAVH
jgi:hypothetical protein